jgi:hypothetical protein
MTNTASSPKMKQDAYDKRIAPLVDKITRLCQDHGICFLGAFGIPSGANTFSLVTTLQPGAGGLVPAPFIESYTLMHGAAPQPATQTAPLQ